jgi:hypothetical protein
MLTPEQQERRRQGIGGSDARLIVEGRWLELYRLKTDPAFAAAQAEEMEWSLPVQLGHATEAVHRKFLARDLGVHIHEPPAGRTSVHPSIPYLLCHPDGICQYKGAMHSVQLKFCNPFNGFDEQAERYYPQIVHEATVLGYDNMILSVLLHAKLQWKRFTIDPDFQRRYLEMCDAFWCHVEMQDPPEETVEPIAPPKPAVIGSELREVDITVEESFANVRPEFEMAAKVWHETRAAVINHDGAKDAMKRLIPDDVGKLYGYGVQVVRAKNGSLSVKEHLSAEQKRAEKEQRAKSNTKKRA